MRKIKSVSDLERWKEKSYQEQKQDELLSLCAEGRVAMLTAVKK